jgi:hypothetical protein
MISHPREEFWRTQYAPDAWSISATPDWPTAQPSTYHHLKNLTLGSMP